MHRDASVHVSQDFASLCVAPESVAARRAHAPQSKKNGPLRSLPTLPCPLSEFLCLLKLCCSLVCRFLVPRYALRCLVSLSLRAVVVNACLP